MLLCIEYDTLFVDTVDTYTGVCGSYTNTLCRCEKLCIKWPLAPAKREGYCIVWAFCLGGLAVHQSEEAALLTFLDLSNYKGDCKQDAQPIPNS